MMKKILIAFIVLASSSLFISCDKPENQTSVDYLDEVINRAGRVIRDKKITSTSLGKDMSYNVILPPGYSEKKEFPFFYLLHGAGDNHNAWLDKGNAEAILKGYLKDGGKPMVVVVPDEATNFWIKEYDGFFHDELIPAVEKEYHGNGKRAVAGNSMGGFCTLFNTFTHPDRFTCAYSMSAVNMLFESTIKEQPDHSAFPSLTIDCGKSDGICPPSQVEEFTAMLDREGVKYELISRDGTHDWTFWKEALATAFDRAGKTF